MRQLNVVRSDFDDFLYPAVAVWTPKDTPELRVQSRILDKLEAEAVPKVKDANGQPSTTDIGYSLKEDGCVFAFETDESALIVKCLERQVQALIGVRGRRLLPMIDQLQEEKK